jgi:hypothetical protein
MKTNWETRHGDRVCYVELHDGFVLAGENEGTIASDAASTATFEAFLAGRFQDSILRDHGAQVLAEVVAAVMMRLGPRSDT